ncbi:coiled-coil domain-containing protein 191 isoform X2 [Prorops nasuta]|uniref:coiled-coil domain-containing protein 191 isoform X2 n=1 Tax=Prorops nasuta TaxID=863751 RepID=UPI0034CDDB81
MICKTRGSSFQSVRDTISSKVKVNDKISFCRNKSLESVMSDTEEVNFPAGIKVTIVEKSGHETEEEEIEILRKAFFILKSYTNEKIRLRDTLAKFRLKKYEERLRKCFDIWRLCVERGEKLAVNQHIKNKNVTGAIENVISDEKRIEMFIDTIARKQKELPKRRDKIDSLLMNDLHSTSSSNRSSATKEIIQNTEGGKCRVGKRVIVQSPAQCRLNAQKKIIEQQKLKLAEQNKTIEELKIKQLQNELRQTKESTVSLTKDVLTNCSQRTRETLIRMMKREESLRKDKDSISSPRVPSPPLFLIRMEERAEARKERVKRTKEARRMKLEEQKRKEEDARREEEEQRRRLQQEVLKKAKKLRIEQEKLKLREIERARKLREQADAFYRRYLLQRYIMIPLKTLVEVKYRRRTMADEHYRRTVMKRILDVWRSEIERRLKVKYDLASVVYDRNLLWRCYANWKKTWQCERKKLQVSQDFYDTKLLDQFFKGWRSEVVEIRLQDLVKEESANKFYVKRLKKKYMELWKKYVLLAEEINESERRTNKLRQIVREIIPDFAPK